MTKQRAGMVLVTYDLLRAALGLPEDMVILAIAQKPEDILDGKLRVVVAHPSLPERLEGAEPRVMTLAQVAEAA